MFVFVKPNELFEGVLIRWIEEVGETIAERGRDDRFVSSFPDNESSEKDESAFDGEDIRCERDFLRNGTIESDDEEEELEDDKSLDVDFDFVGRPEREREKKKIFFLNKVHFKDNLLSIRSILIFLNDWQEGWGQTQHDSHLIFF